MEINMEFLKISSGKVKIMLSAADMQKWKLSSDSKLTGDSILKSRVFKLLDHVKRHYDFEYEGDKLLIQFYPSRDGGAELFVTKLGLLSKSGADALEKSREITILNNKRSMYAFSSFSDLLLAAKAICVRNKERKSELFVGESGTYYLEIFEFGDSKGSIIPEYALMLEFASPVPKERISYITEHGECLTVGNAVEVLASLA